MEYRIFIIGIRFSIKKSKNCSATTAGKARLKLAPIDQSNDPDVFIY